MYALCADKLCAATLSRFPARAHAESKHFCYARNYIESRPDGRQPGTISELRRDPEGFEKFAVKVKDWLTKGARAIARVALTLYSRGDPCDRPGGGGLS